MDKETVLSQRYERLIDKYSKQGGSRNDTKIIYGGIKRSCLKPKTLSWKNVNVYAPQEVKSCNIFSKNSAINEIGTKQLLFNVCGTVNSGEILAIMGASGAGKTTLMNFLTGYSGQRLRMHGSVHVNGKNIGKKMKYLSAYVQQDDLFVNSLTVREHLTFRAQLLVKNDTTDCITNVRIDEVISEFGMESLEHVRIGNCGETNALSAGERKRLSFASEVITNPNIMFCDEPTSGLDSYMAQTVVETLKSLAVNGRTIICTIHQPSSEVFELIDKLCLLAEGHVAFFGKTNETLRFFKNAGYSCPLNYDPADFFIRTLAIIPGNEIECRKRVQSIISAFENTEVAKNMQAEIDKSEIDAQKGVSNTENIIPLEDNMHYKATWSKQFKLLLWRTWVNNARNPVINRARIIQCFIISFIVGIIYWQQNYDQKGTMNINGALFLLQLQLSYANIFMVVNAFPSEYPLFRREYLNALYRIDTYYLSHVLAELPIFLCVPLITSLITYFMIGLYISSSAFFIYLMGLMLMSLVTIAVGHAISTATVNVTLAVAIAPLILNPVMFFGGYFINIDTIPWYSLPLKWISWFFYTNELLVVNQWQNVNNIYCEYKEPIFVYHNFSAPEVYYDTSMCYNDGYAVIDSCSFSLDRTGYDIFCLFMLLIGFELFAFIGLYCRVKQ